jgi:cytochrome c-type biogenesis protein CcmH/NrfG
MIPRMLRPWSISSFLFVFVAALAVGQAPAPEKAITPKTDYSQEAFVVENFSRKQRFENDGTSSQQDTARVRIQSQAGVQKYGILSFSYPGGTGNFAIEYVRVLKPDGTIVETPPENVQDMAAEITRQAPFYSDLREKHVAVKGLGVGDVLEFRTEEQTTKPLVAGQFWTQYSFTQEQIVLNELLEISVPRDRAVRVTSTGAEPQISAAGNYRIYSWHHASLKPQDESAKKWEATEHSWKQMRGRLPQPDVLMTSFASWDEVGHWFGSLMEDRVKPTPEVRAKAMELTRSAANDEEKIRILYSYVSTQFHYIGIAFGIGRYQPHSAAEVLANEYGDCKDKHTLLASLLAAIGIPAYPALISTTHELDTEVPSPGQADHVITVVPRTGGLVWLDSTAEVGPYQYLLSPLRDKHALVIWRDKPAALVNTPADLPYGTAQTFSMEAKLNDAGTLEGNAQVSQRGDLEFLLRSVFRAVPLTNWKELAQRISLGSGFGGEVSDVTASSPEKTDEPFHFAYKYTRKEFGDWANRRILAPSPALTLGAPGDEELLPLGPSWLGPPAEIQLHSEVQLPAGYRPELPVSVHVKRDFAQYDAIYEFKDGKLISNRHLKTLMREVPVSEREEYKQFVKTLQDDYGVYIPLHSQSGSVAATNNTPKTPSIDALRSLPDSQNTEATRLESSAREAMANHDAQSAESSLYRAVSADPKFTRAWVLLGGMLLMQKQVDAGVDAFNKAIASDPTQAAIPKALDWSLMAASKFEDAVPVWQDYVKAHPDDLDGTANLATCLMQLKRYSEAAAAYEGALKRNGNRADLQASLGSAYLLAGERDKAVETFSKLTELDPQGNTFNDTAYQMANADLKLPLALDFAKKAARTAEEESQKITLSDLKLDDLKGIQKLAAYWDTLGWVNDKMSNLQDAQNYLLAAWKLTQDGVAASHLCQVYERLHKFEAAIQMCNLAVYRIPMSEQLGLNQYQPEIEEANKRLDHLMRGTAKSKSVGNPSEVVSRERNFKLARFLPGTESAEFFILFASDGKGKTFKVEDVKFVSGSDKLKLQEKQLRAIDFNFPAPTVTPTRFVRRGILGCYQYSGCSFLLLEPAAVQSLN